MLVLPPLCKYCYNRPPSQARTCFPRRGRGQLSRTFFSWTAFTNAPFHPSVSINNTRHPRAEDLHCTLFNTAAAFDTVQNEALLLTKDLHTRSVLEVSCTCKKRPSVALANPVAGQGSYVLLLMLSSKSPPTMRPDLS